MEPVIFAEFNRMLEKPDDMTDEECSSLPVFTDGKQCVSCWRMSWKERLSALLFGKAWLYVLSGSAQPPVALEIANELNN